VITTKGNMWSQLNIADWSSAAREEYSTIRRKVLVRNSKIARLSFLLTRCDHVCISREKTDSHRSPDRWTSREAITTCSQRGRCSFSASSLFRKDVL